MCVCIYILFRDGWLHTMSLWKVLLCKGLYRMSNFKLMITVPCCWTLLTRGMINKVVRNKTK